MEFQRRLAGGPKVDHATAGALPAGVWGSLWLPLRRRDTTAASRTEALRGTPRMPEPFWDG